MEQATPPAAAGVDLSPAATDLGRVHLLPCGIRHNSAAAVSDYFKPRDTGVEVDGVKVEEAFFRGRNLQGATVALPDGYRGPSSFEQIMKNLGLENLRRKELDLTSKIFRGLCRILVEPKIATKLEFSHNLRTIVMVPYDVGRSLPFHAFSKICYVLEKKKNEEKDAQGMDEEASNFVSHAEFQNITYWNHDTMPSAEDPLPRCFHWLAVANAMHKPVTAEDMANMSARQNQNS